VGKKFRDIYPELKGLSVNKKHRKERIHGRGPEGGSFEGLPWPVGNGFSGKRYSGKGTGLEKKGQ